MPDDCETTRIRQRIRFYEYAITGALGVLLSFALIGVTRFFPTSWPFLVRLFVGLASIAVVATWAHGAHLIKGDLQRDLERVLPLQRERGPRPSGLLRVIASKVIRALFAGLVLCFLVNYFVRVSDGNESHGIIEEKLFGGPAR